MTRLLTIALAGLLASACGSASEPTEPATAVATTTIPSTAAPQPPPTSTAPTTPPTTTPRTTTRATTTTSAAPTTTRATSTTAALPVEPWHVAGQAYYFPVQPPSAADYGREHHDYPATDIFAPEGSTLVAVTDGVVEEVSRVDPWVASVNDPATRGGLFVSLIGDDGVRYYYSHLLAVAPGVEAATRLRAGQVIGTVGRTGNAATTPPHVHFGISPPTSPGDWQVRRGVVPPYEYLRSWTAGNDVTPPLP